MMKGWLAVWLPVLCVLSALPLEGVDPWAALVLAGCVFWGLGIAMAHYTVGRGTLAAFTMLGGLFAALFAAGFLAGGLGLADRPAASLLVLGLTAGLQFALGGAPLAVVLLNLAVFGGLLAAAVATSDQNWLLGLAMFLLGPPALLAPSAAISWLRRRRGDDLSNDYRGLERLLRTGLGVVVIAFILLIGFTEESGNVEYWLGSIVIIGLILFGLRK